jgi:hypothetical protein
MIITNFKCCLGSQSTNLIYTFGGKYLLLSYVDIEVPTMGFYHKCFFWRGGRGGRGANCLFLEDKHVPIYDLYQSIR